MKKEEIIKRYGQAAYDKMREQSRLRHIARYKALPRKSKVIDLFSVEGVQLPTLYRTANNGKSFCISTYFCIAKGYRGSYKGKRVTYKKYCPHGFVRHHNHYNDLGYDDGVVLVTRAEHIKIHAELKRRGETVPTTSA